MNDVCWPCRRGQHLGCAAELTDETCTCDHLSTGAALSGPVGTFGDALGMTSSEPSEPASEDSGRNYAENPLNLSDESDYDSSTRTRRYKNDAAVTDQQSTGRKRAAKMYPLKDANGNPLPCDFANKPQCLPKFMEVQIDGCGVRPGTLPSKAQARHHHDYNTLNNERSNVGLLCTSCHNLLHARNDPYKDVIYERLYGFKPATEDLKHANKALKSGVVGGGVIKKKEDFNL